MAFHSGLTQGLRGLAGLALNALLPPRCLSCGATVERPGALCAACWKGIHFLAPPLCEHCGFPLEFELGPGALCGACARERPVFDRARSVMRYDGLCGASRSIPFKIRCYDSIGRVIRDMGTT